MPQVGTAVAITGIVGGNIGGCAQVIVFSRRVKVDPQFSVVKNPVLTDKVSVIGQRNRTTAGIVDDHYS